MRYNQRWVKPVKDQRLKLLDVEVRQMTWTSAQGIFKTYAVMERSRLRFRECPTRQATQDVVAELEVPEERK